MNKSKPYKHIFIVGSPRSGTTLLQGMLASHSEIFSLPETFFFVKATQGHFLKRNLLWPAAKVYGHLEKIVRELGRGDLVSKARIGFFERDYAKRYIEILDRVTADLGKTIWVEKTPWHLRSIDEILEQVPDAVFIHIVRDGKDVVASLFHATNTHTEAWATLQPSWYPGFLKFKPYSTEDCVEIWNKDISITRSVFGEDKHFVVNYEELVTFPREVIQGVADFIGIDFEDSMLNPANVSSTLTRKNELWKSNNASSIKKSGGLFEKVFNPQQRDWVTQHLNSHFLAGLSDFSHRKGD